ncbi:hypothetical protein [Epilithonimonas sp.]|uniref:hypothetical protein n=1 Tax=Epilithonimonas sp. TaxID=2894511 RepID=UPI00289801A1|nr:hypothetical protein [Epilithonimonas sp.]
MKKKIFLLILVLVISRFFLGIYKNDEFGGNHLFIKHRPTWHWYFYSPVGLSDKTNQDLSEEEQLEQQYWDEFIKSKIELE